MATLATLIDRITGQRTEAVRDDSEQDYFSRALPNESIYFWVRPIDNGRLMAQPTPGASQACWKSIGAALLAAGVLVAVLLPLAYNLLAGYQLRALDNDHQKLLEERALLEKREAELLSPERLATLAEMQQLVDPEPQHLIPLPPVSDGSLAMNR